MGKSVWVRAAEIVDRKGLDGNYHGCCHAFDEVATGTAEETEQWSKFVSLFRPDSCPVYWWSRPWFDYPADRTARVLALLFMELIERDRP